MPTENLNRMHKVEGGSNRSFGLVMAAFFCLVGAWPILGGQSLRVWALIISGGFLLAGIFSPNALGPLNKLWIKLGLLLNQLVSPLALGIVFIASVVPVAILMRLFGKDPLHRKLDAKAVTYWIQRHPSEGDSKTMTRQF